MFKLFTVCVIVLLGSAIADSGYDLWIAAKHGYLADVEDALAAGADPDWGNEDWSNVTALHSAGSLNYVRIMNALLEAGANTDVECLGMYPLHVAAELGYIDAVRTLITHGADLNMQTRGYTKTALMIATEYGFVNIAEALIDAHANLGLVNEYGLTALHSAALHNQPKIAQLLLKKGADANQPDDQGKTAQDIAYEQGLRREELESFSVRIALASPTEPPVKTKNPACILWARLWKYINTRLT